MENKMSSIIYAAQIADRYHAGQVRKYNGKPFISHPIRVAGRIATHKNATEIMVTAGFLHDLVEDTSVQISDIIEWFGEDVAKLVSELTNDKAIEGTREERKRAQRLKLKDASYEAKVIKLIDRIDNLNELPQAQSFTFLYAKESLLLLNEALTGVDQDLESELHNIIMVILNKE